MVLCTTAALAGAVLCGPRAADARTFNIVRPTPDAWTIIDPSAVERLPGGIVRRTWMVTVQRNIASGGASEPGYVRTLTEYDCSRGETRWRSFSAFSRSGDLLMTRENAWPQWGPATAKPEVNAAYRIVCEGGYGDGAISAESIARLVITLMGSWDTPAQSLPGAPVTPATTAAKPATARPR